MTDVHYRVDKQECKNCGTVWFSSVYNLCPNCEADVNRISKTSGVSFKEISKLLEEVDFQ